MPGALASLILLMLEIHGAGVCPAPAAVERRLHAIDYPVAEAAADPPGGPPDEVRLNERQDGSLEVTMLGGGGTRARKILPASPDCSERAEMVAVALAAWE
ncbi:MAG: hypothetical protein ABI560_19725, partial [Myxococcales bacterium]